MKFKNRIFASIAILRTFEYLSNDKNIYLGLKRIFSEMVNLRLIVQISYFGGETRLILIQLGILKNQNMDALTVVWNNELDF